MALCVAQETYKVNGEHQYALQFGGMYICAYTYVTGFAKTDCIVTITEIHNIRTQ